MAVAAGKKAADNPAGGLFLAVLVGAVLIQGVRNLPDFGEWAWNKVVPWDVTAPFDKTKESILETWETEDQIIQGFEDITPSEDPLERRLFGDFSGAMGPGDEEEFGFWQTGYRGAREGLFTGLRSPWSPF